MQADDNNKMEGMVAIVTGASRGLGRAIAKEFAAEGAKVVVSARRSSPTGLPGTTVETAEQIREAGGEAMALTCDVSDEEQVVAMVSQTIDMYGQIDVLVNNAGVMVLGETLLDIDPEKWDQSVAANLRGPYLCSRSVLPWMIEQGRGSIINLGSRMGHDHAQGGGVLYSATKAAVHMFSFCLADEVREHNIAVNILSPGGLKTEGSAAIPWTQRDWEQRVEPEAVGPSAVYLALQDASTFTGQLVLRAEFGETWGT
ncbi:MAG: SDR family oxidoreductase [SAR202 cluster bacterium]|nr:SDR family oxidoreductase [SAR202 cluster bacterium]|tara:strand:+ start:3763 stop:4533 length:771 start_codon:yes stop_codon:yes gene_type:complete